MEEIEKYIMSLPGTFSDDSLANDACAISIHKNINGFFILINTSKKIDKVLRNALFL